MPLEADPIRLTKQQRMELNEIARSLSLPAGFALRVKIILLLADGCSYDALKAKLDTTAPTISRWKKRFLEALLDGFATPAAGTTSPYAHAPAAARRRVLRGTKRRPSKPWIVATVSCRCLPLAPSVTASSTNATAPCRCTRRSTPAPRRCRARGQLNTPAGSSPPSSTKWSSAAIPGKRCTSSATTFRLTRPSGSRLSSHNTRGRSFISHCP